MKRYFFLLAIFAFFVYYMTHNLALLKDTLAVSMQTTAAFQIAALVAVLLAIYFFGRSLGVVFKIFDKKRSGKETTILTLQSQAFNVLFPTGGFSVAALYSRDARKRGEKIASAIAAFIVFALVGYISLSIVLVAAIIYLVFTHSLTHLVIIPAAILILVTLLLLLLLYLSEKQDKFIYKVLNGANKILFSFLNIFRKKKVEPGQGIESFVRELALANEDIRINPRSMLYAVGFMLLYHLLNLVALYILFMSFGFFPMYRILFTGYAVGSLLTIISPTPSGVGFAEAGMVASFTSLGIGLNLASTVVILYRGLSFWLVLFVGFVLLQREGLLTAKNGEESLKSE